MRGNSVAIVLALALGVAPLWAEDRSLIIGNDPVDPASTVAVATEVNRISRALNGAGFTTLDGSNLATAALRSRLDRILRDLGPTDTLVIMLAGDFVHSSGQTWFLAPNSGDTTGLNLVSIGAVAINLATVFELAGMAPGRALVMLGTDGNRLALGRGLSAGLGRFDIPQGVAVVQGGTADLSRFALTGLVTRGQSLAQMLGAAKGMTAAGYLPQGLAFRTAATGSPGAITDDGAAKARAAIQAAEAKDWAAAQKLGSIAAYQAYVDAHPSGLNAATARAELSRLRNDPTLLAQQAEDALKLDREQRRAVQRQLTLLGFDTRGIDGIFGRGSRSAIIAWQKAQNAPASGYLSAVELQRLSAAADRRAAELEAEAAARQAQLDREDRSFWDRSGASGEEDGLRTYLRQFPDGLYADIAANRLQVFDLKRQNAAAAQDRAAWAQAEKDNNIDSYTAYLDQFPQGAFVAEAKARVAAAQDAAEGGDSNRAAAQTTEDGLGLNPVTRKLIETRLASLGFDPGPADGVFDEKTRRAIRRFQKARGQEVTGYINQTAIVALLAGAVFDLGN
ncbi:peptidoglycan-binding protein [Pseudorhodobacter sp.]|uniref:peptidoglycan-binding domain-containing protein n=1 Tax=Pseudorhodobacter sp. TaxID=1934400 RepID=UPI0039E64A22